MSEPDPERARRLEELDRLIDELTTKELLISHRRRIVHGKLEILWTERERLRRRPADDPS